MNILKSARGGKHARHAHTRSCRRCEPTTRIHLQVFKFLMDDRQLRRRPEAQIAPSPSNIVTPFDVIDRLGPGRRDPRLPKRSWAAVAREGAPGEGVRAESRPTGERAAGAAGRARFAVESVRGCGNLPEKRKAHPPPLVPAAQAGQQGQEARPFQAQRPVTAMFLGYGQGEQADAGAAASALSVVAPTGAASAPGSGNSAAKKSSRREHLAGVRASAHGAAKRGNIFE